MSVGRYLRRYDKENMYVTNASVSSAVKAPHQSSKVLVLVRVVKSGCGESVRLNDLHVIRCNLKQKQKNALKTVSF